MCGSAELCSRRHTEKDVTAGKITAHSQPSMSRMSHDTVWGFSARRPFPQITRDAGNLTLTPWRRQLFSIWFVEIDNKNPSSSQYTWIFELEMNCAQKRAWNYTVVYLDHWQRGQQWLPQAFHRVSIQTSTIQYTVSQSFLSLSHGCFKLTFLSVSTGDLTETEWT